MQKILIVDDDDIIRDKLDYLLSDEYITFCATNKKEVFTILQKNDINLCLLDVNLKEENGFDLCKTIRQEYSMPIIFITVNDDEDSLEEGLLSGGDDYVVKPFSMRELKLRIMAQLRRNTYTYHKNDVIRVNEWKMDFSRHQFSFHDVCLEISNTEFILLGQLLKNRGCLVTRNTLLDEITEQNDSFVEDNTLSVHVSRIRNKMMKKFNCCPIETIRGIGYRWKENA